MRPALSSFAIALAAVTALTAAACGSTYTSHVEADEATLGRVVVYRNGIAYYERVAEVRDGRLTLTVPHDKVDDFLKSLTVKDARTGATLPVAFPTSGATSEGKVDMQVQVSEPGVHQVILTYITESPAWKPSYRVMVDGDDVQIQGWAIVDNTSGERWENVRIGVGSSSALSFRYDLRSVRTVFRETLRGEERFAVAPPTGGSTRPGGDEQRQVIAAIDQRSIPGATPTPDDMAYDTLAAETGSEGEGLGGLASRRTRGDRAAGVAKATPTARPHALTPPPPVKELAERLNQSRGQVVIEGYADAGERDADGVAADRANWMRNELIREGVAPARLEVAAKGHVAGQAGGVRLVQVDNGDAPDAGDGDPVGESHFQSDAPVTVDRGTSAMIAILDDAAEGNIVYLYDAESARGNDRFAFKAIRFKNPTESTLETGPMTVYGDGRFIGEGLSEPIPPRSTAVVPFALDRQVIVEREGSTGDRIARLITLQRGILRTEVRHTRTTKLKVTSVLHKPTEVFVRHTVRKGWKLVESPEIFERTGEAHLFKIVLKPGETRTLTIEEATPLVKTIDVRSSEGVELVRAYLEGGDAVDARFAEPMRRLLAVHTEMANTRQSIAATRERLVEYRERMAELQGQIVSLDGVRGGNTLLRHLQTRLREMSDRVQKDTIAVVDLQEQLMLARIRFQDGVAELSFEERVSTAPDTTPGA